MDSELVIEGGVRALLRAAEGARLRSAVRETHLLDLHRGEVNAALADARLIEVVVLQGALLAHGDVALVQEDQAFLPEGAPQQDAVLWARPFLELLLLGGERGRGRIS